MERLSFGSPINLLRPFYLDISYGTACDRSGTVRRDGWRGWVGGSCAVRAEVSVLHAIFLLGGDGGVPMPRQWRRV